MGFLSDLTTSLKKNKTGVKKVSELTKEDKEKNRDRVTSSSWSSSGGTYEQRKKDRIAGAGTSSSTPSYAKKSVSEANKESGWSFFDLGKNSTQDKYGVRKVSSLGKNKLKTGQGTNRQKDSVIGAKRYTYTMTDPTTGEKKEITEEEYNRLQKEYNDWLENTRREAEEDRKIQRGAAKAELMPGKTVDFMNAMEKNKEKQTGEKGTTFAYPWQTDGKENLPTNPIEVKAGTPYATEAGAMENWQRQIDEQNARAREEAQKKADEFYAISGGQQRAEKIPGGTTDLFNQLENQKAKKTGEKGTTFGSGVRKPRAAGEQSFTEYINGLGEKAAQKKAEEPAEAPVQQQPVQRQEKPAEPVISKEDAGYKNADRGMKWGYPSNYSAKAPEATIAQTPADQEVMDKVDADADTTAKMPGTAPILPAQPQSRAPQNAAPRRSNEDLQKDLDKHMLELYKQAEEKSKTYAGYDGFTDWAKTKGIYQEGTLLEWVTPAIYKDYLQEKMSRAGLYDTGTDVKNMSYEGLKNAEAYWNLMADELRDEADDLQDWYDDPADRGDIDDLLSFTGDVLGTLNDDDRGTDEYNKLVEDAAQRMMYSSLWGYQRTGEEGEQDKLRRSLYESIMKGEQYDDIVEYLDEEPEALDELNGILDKMIDNMLQHNTKAIQDVDKELQGMRDSADAYEYYSGKAKEELESRDWVEYYDKMSYNINPELSKTSGEYDPTRVADPQINLQGALDNSIVGKLLMNPFQQGKETFQFGRDVSDIDKKYWLANNAINLPVPASELDDVCFMNDQEREIFNKLYAYSYPKEGIQKSGLPEKFLEKIEPMLKQRKIEYNDILARNVAQEKKLGIGTVARLASYADKPIAGVEVTAETIKSLFGDKDAAKLDTKGKNLTRWINATRDQQNKDFSELVETWAGEFGGKAARLIADCTDSVVDNLVAMAIGKGVAGGTAKMITSPAARKVAQYAIQLIMSSEATASSFVEKLDGGMEGSEAAKYAIGDGIIEWITEKFSLETILNPDYMAQGTWKYLIRSAAAEGSEEIASDLLNMGLDSCLSYMDKHKTELVQKYYELLASGEYKGKEKEAWRQVLGDKMGEIMKSGLSGALSGLAMSGGHLVSTKQALRTEGEKMLKTDKTAQGAGTIDSLLEAGKNIGEGSRSFSLAEKLEQLKKNNKKLSKLEVGKLSEQIQLEAREKADEAAKGTVYDTVHESLKAEGLQGNELQNVADAVTTALMEGENKLTKAQKKALQSSKEGSHLLEMMRNNEEQQDSLYKKVQESVQPYTEAAEVAENLSRGKTKEGISVEDVNKQMATEAQQRQAEGEQTTGKGAAIVKGKWALLTGNTKTEKRNGKTVVLWEADTNGKTDYVESSDISTMDFGIGAIVRQTALKKSIFSDSFAKTVFDAANREKVNIGILLRDAEKLKRAAYYGFAMPKTELSEDMANNIWLASLEEMKNQRKAEVSKGNFTGKAGVISFNGAEYGTAEYEQALDEANVSKRMRKMMDAAARIAQVARIAGLQFMTAEQMKGAGIYGSEDAGGVKINIEGEDLDDAGNKLGTHHILVTLGHEMTHWLQRNSLGGYNQLRQFVLTSMAQQGVNIDDRVDELIALYGMKGKELDLNGAISEIVANACDQILTNETVQQHLAESNPTLYGKIKEFAEDLVKRIRDAAAQLINSASKDSMNLDMLKYGNALAKMWLGAYDEVISGAIGEIEGVSETGDNTQVNYSFQDMQKKTWDEQVDWMLSPNARKSDVMELASKEETKGIGLDVPIALRHSVLNKMLRDPKYTSRSGHKLNISDVREIKDAILHPVAKIEKGNTTYIVTDYMVNGNEPVVLIGEKTNEFTKGGVLDSKSIHGRTSITTLFGKYVDGVFKADENAKIWKYKNNANEILSLGPVQFGAGQEVIDAIDRLTQEDEKVNLSIAEGRENRYQAYTMEELEDAYMDAAEHRRMDEAEDILFEKLRRTEGIIPYKAAHGYGGKYIEIAREGIKKKYGEAIAQAAEDMSQEVSRIPGDVVLVPMPPHTGVVTEDTDTMVLARAISELTGKPVVNALEGTDRESRHNEKLSGKKGVSAQQMEMRQVDEIPEGAMPVFIDNLVNKGETAKAAHDAIGRGITLAYAKHSRGTPVQGLKNLTVTYDKNTGEVIPLGRRLDINSQDVNLSINENKNLNEYKYKVLPRDKTYFDNIFKNRPNITITQIKNPTPVNIKPDGKIDMQQIVDAVRNNPLVKKVNFNNSEDRYYVYVPDLKLNVELSGEGISHGFRISNDIHTNTDNAMLAQYIPEILQNAIEVNRGNKYTGNKVKAEHILVAGVRIRANNQVQDYGVRIIIQNREGYQAQLDRIDVIGKLKSINEKKTQIKSFQGNKARGARPTSSSMRLSDFFKDVKHDMNDIFTENVYKKANMTREENDFSRYLQFSMSEGGLDVQTWMNSLTPGVLRNDAERQLLQDYKGKRVSIDLNRKIIREYEEKIRTLESKDQLTAAERSDLTALRNKLEIRQQKMERLENELDEITSKEGYAGMMYYWNKVLNDTVFGKTQAQVDAAVTEMQKTAEEVAKEIGKRQKELQALRDESSVKVIRRELGRKGLNRYAKALKDFHKTAMTEEELQGRMAEIVLQTVQGQDAQPDIEALAEDLVNRSDGDLRNEALYRLGRLRGLTVKISAGEMAEAKARGWSLKEIRDMTRGSGIRFEESTNRQSTLKNDVQEILDENPELNDGRLENEDALVNFVDYVADMLEQAHRAGNEFGGDPAEAAGSIRAVLNVMLSGDAGGMSGEELNAKIRREAGRVAAMQDDLNRLKERTDALLDAGMKAKRWTDVLQNDMGSAVEYYDKTAKQAAQVARQQVREGVIKQLKSENAKKLIAQQQKYEEMIKNDRKARETAEDNLKQRKMINTNISRLKNLLTAETDQKNIPEEAKPLARMLVGMLAKHDAADYRHVLFADKKQRADLLYRLQKMDATYGEFDADRDLDWLVVKANDPADNDTSAKDRVIEDLMAIEMGLVEYRNAEGQGYISLKDRNAALTKIEEAVAEIYDVIRARQQIQIGRRRFEVAELAEQAEDEMRNSRFKGEKTSGLGKAVDSLYKAVGYGNLTPEYFFRNLKNSVMSLLHGEYHNAEQRSGLEAYKARQALAKIAAETGYANWDGQEKHTVKLASGKEIVMTTEQLMSLYATWKREQNALRPEDTSHLLNGGIVLAEDGDKGKGLMGVKKMDTRPIRMKESDLDSIGDYLTDSQKEYADRMVEYMSSDLAELGNEASMRMFGIKKFTEQYYFPIKSWGGVLNQRSDAGVTNSSENRAARASFTKRLKANARNAVEIGDFTATATKHIVGMINYNTVAPAVENMNRVLNQQLKFGESTVDMDTGEEEDNTYKLNVRAAFRNAYGKLAADYLAQFMQDINGGVGRAYDTSLKEKLLSVFRKGAVSGSLSVAMQQPLSYIRAAMAIDPKYLSAALLPNNWGRIHQEMLDHSGIAVIKDMGRFDMNQGLSMIEYITPEAKEKAAKRAWGKISDATTALPNIMDAVTWGRMWVACKLEQKAQNPGMDVTSDEFLDKVAERFNDVIRKTQVYDSVMVKSQNMRSRNYAVKSMTSFMSEPTLSLNVLADAVMNAKEKGGTANVAKAAATFLLSAALQAAAKGLMSSGRSPDKKKTWEEQFLIKWGNAFLSEANPLTLIPGYSDIIELFKKGELSDDAMGALGKLRNVIVTGIKWGTGKSTDTYRNFEDTAGQLFQLFTNLPAKNLMRDARAIYNFVNPDTYAGRESNAAVVKYGLIDSFYNADNLTGMLNSYLVEAGAGYDTKNSAYQTRLYLAQKAGDEKTAKEIRDYLVLAKMTGSDPEKQLDSQLRSMAKKDGDLSAEEKLEMVADTSDKADGVRNYILEQLKNGELDREAALSKMKELYPDKDENDLWWSVDRAVYKNETGTDKVSGYYYRLKDAVASNRSGNIGNAIRELLDHGVTAKQVKDQLSKEYKQDYLAADENGRIRIRNAMQLAYKELGLTAEDADKTIKGWKAK